MTSEPEEVDKINKNCNTCVTQLTNSNHLSKFTVFIAHKCILAACSPVFKAMFNYKLKENLANIEDSRPEVIQILLKYIYTAYIPEDISNVAVGLYIVAEEYFIESLKIKCREYLIYNMSSDNVIEIYLLSELYNDSIIREQNLKFVFDNVDNVTQNAVF